MARPLPPTVRPGQIRTLRSEAARLLGGAASLPEGMEAWMDSLCDTLGGGHGACWMLQEPGQAPACLARGGDVAADAASGAEVGAHAGSLVQRAWRTGQPAWHLAGPADARSAIASPAPAGPAGDDDAAAPEHPLLPAAGFGALYAIPLHDGNSVVAVLELLFRAPLRPADAWLDAVRRLGSDLARCRERLQWRQQQQRSDARLHRLFKLSSECYWEQDAQLRFSWSSGTPLGTDAPGGWMGRCPWDIAGLDVLNGDWSEHQARLAARLPFKDFETTRRDAAGAQRYFSDSGEPVFDADGRFQGYHGISRDITGSVIDRKLLALEHDITRRIAEAEGLGQAVLTVIRLICEFENWECGDYWLLDPPADSRRLLYSWGIDTPAIQRFIDQSRGMVAGLQEGYVGQVVRSGRPFWQADMTQSAPTARSRMAREAGLHGLFILPVISGGTMLAAIGFSSREIREPNPRLLQAFSVIGNQMGQFLRRKQAEQVLRESEARFRALTDLSSDWYWEEDRQARLTRVEGRGADSMAHFVGRTAEELGFVAEEGWDAFHAIKTARRPFRDLVMSRQVGNDTHYLSVSGEPTFDGEHRFCGYRGVTRDVTERKRAEVRIRYLAMHDGLTGLPNRVMFSHLLLRAIETAHRYERRFAVMFIDLDRFKLINDTLGHEAGDHLLREIASRLKAALRSSDVVARLGGDEFVVLLQETGSPADVAAAARKMLSAVIQPMTICGQECRVTTSIGISMYPADAEDEPTLMKNADLAMYTAKEAGKNNFQFYSRDSRSQALEKMLIETHLRRELALHYQAKLDLASQRICGVEALLRWTHPELGTVSPAQFIPLAEETGLIVAIGKWVLRTACEQSMAWQRQGLPATRMAVNLSPRQFNDPELLDDLAAILRETGLPPQLLELEITEGMVMHDTERILALLQAIKALGVSLAIDDFGTGYSSLSQLRRLPIDTLKVDRSFIREITQSAEDKAIAEAIIRMGKTLSLTVVAEGVETPEQMALLRSRCCDQMQGYHFSQPVAAERFAELLLEHEILAPAWAA
jgi:diguanylate cyclase (GGDEF)-like protein